MLRVRLNLDHVIVITRSP